MTPMSDLPSRNKRGRRTTDKALKPLGEAPLDGVKNVTQKDVDDALIKIQDVASIPESLWSEDAKS